MGSSPLALPVEQRVAPLVDRDGNSYIAGEERIEHDARARFSPQPGHESRFVGPKPRLRRTDWPYCRGYIAPHITITFSGPTVRQTGSQTVTQQ
jgi:hypothetical protein